MSNNNGTKSSTKTNYDFVLMQKAVDILDEKKLLALFHRFHGVRICILQKMIKKNARSLKSVKETPIVCTTRRLVSEDTTQLAERIESYEKDYNRIVNDNDLLAIRITLKMFLDLGFSKGANSNYEFLYGALGEGLRK